MNKKGFTLIELLAVIVILAIIALIAVPIVLNIINDSKEQSTMRSAELYEKAVQNAIMKKQLDGTTKIKDGDYVVVDSKGNICLEEDYKGTESTCPTDSYIEIDVEGEIPEVGSTLKIGEDYTIATSTLNFKTKKVVKDENGKRTISAKGSTPTPQVTKICDLKEGDSQEIGSKYECDLDTKRTFYILEIGDGENETPNGSVTLIMDRNLGNSEWLSVSDFAQDNPTRYQELQSQPWCSSAGHCVEITSGSLTVNAYLQSQTSNWCVTATLPTYNQILSFRQINPPQPPTYPTWIQGSYWTSTTIPKSSGANMYAYLMSTNTLSETIISTKQGIRPVITIPTSALD